MMRVAIRLAGSLLPVCLSGLAFGQAWIPPKGQGSVNFGYSWGHVDTHIFSSSIYGLDAGPREQDYGEIDSQTVLLGVAYGVTERFALGLDLAQVGAQYTGTFPESPEIDDGSWHRGIQDLRIGFRYQAYKGPMVVTPFAGAVVPVGNYDHFGHAALGRHLNEFPFGVSLGAPFGKKRVHSYLLANYAYSIVEELEGIDTNRSNANLEFGFFPTKKLVLRAVGGWQDTHGGLDWATDVVDEETAHNHDVVANSDYWTAGAGVAYSINPNLDVYGSWNAILSGSNTHDLETITAGLSWNFGKGLTGGRKIGGRYGPDRASVEEDRDLARVTTVGKTQAGGF